MNMDIIWLDIYNLLEMNKWLGYVNEVRMYVYTDTELSRINFGGLQVQQLKCSILWHNIKEKVFSAFIGDSRATDE